MRIVFVGPSVVEVSLLDLFADTDVPSDLPEEEGESDKLVEDTELGVAVMLLLLLVEFDGALETLAIDSGTGRLLNG